jgi:hypothetical protein
MEIFDLRLLVGFLFSCSSEVTAISSEFGNSAKIIVPRSWLDKRFLQSEYISKHPKERAENEQ